MTAAAGAPRSSGRWNRWRRQPFPLGLSSPFATATASTVALPATACTVLPVCVVRLPPMDAGGCGVGSSFGGCGNQLRHRSAASSVACGMRHGRLKCDRFSKALCMIAGRRDACGWAGRGSSASAAGCLRAGAPRKCRALQWPRKPLQMMLVACRGCELQRHLAPDVSSARGGTHFGGSGAFHVMRSTLARTQVNQKHYISSATLAPSQIHILYLFHRAGVVQSSSGWVRI